ncbi:leukotriene A-4 hydrolase-like [Biomphalaria glabrata]|uniref:Leukotriene A-4 hydrolase-like n=1 Tax=Biomphalaria glabrata TaxID=6526 RepID=A0A9W3A7V5_BIOGL|nr:leukotriene A-4 hydrolase-like [Biomphalaria glabrata]
MTDIDPNSYSEPRKAVVTKLDWDVSINFDSTTVSGYAELTVDSKVDVLDTLVLDSRDLVIEEIQVKETGATCNYEITNPLKFEFGSKLIINLSQISLKSFTLRIKYRTAPNASALTWLRKEQTAGKRHPYLYSQCQAIHARSLFPCQDTPSVKFTYTAKIHAPKELTVLMSAKRLGTEPQSSSEMVTTKFEQNIPIPSYLVAIVAGDIECRDLGPRSKVWSEKELVDRAAFEFSQTEDMLRTAEQLMGDYVWGPYDLMVLPPSFPYGGMENPCLTFVTPTLLAGDKSLADVIAHEISHSWTGNLVTNSSFEHFWLNEGHTMFLERKILGRLHDPLLSQLHAHQGWKSFNKNLKDTKVPFTKLVPNLRGVDPDDAFSLVPYEKGFALLYSLELLLGGPDVFEPFLRKYVEHFKYKSITTADWKEYLFQYFSSEENQKKLSSFDWETWLHGEGLPPYQPNYDLSLAKPSDVLAQKWLQQPEDSLDVFTEADISSLSSILILEFVSKLHLAEPPVSLAKVKQLELVYKFNGVKNSELRFEWLMLCIKVKWEDCVPHALDFVNEQGRMKFVRPIYKKLGVWEYSRPKAIANYKLHREEMHNTTAMLVAKDLNLDENEKE